MAQPKKAQFTDALPDDAALKALEEPSREVQEVPDDELPPAFDDDSASTNGVTPGSSYLSVEEITDVAFNPQVRSAIHKAATAPAGDYTKTERWDTFKKTLQQDDCLPNDTYERGRVVYTVSGRPDKRAVDGVEYDPMLMLRLSPDYRADRNDPTRPDFLCRTYDRVCEVYLSVNGKELRSERDLRDFLVDGEYTINTYQQDDGRLGTGNIKRKMKPGERYSRR